MDLPRFFEILKTTTMPLRKGEIEERRLSNRIEVIDVYFMPRVDDEAAKDLVKVDVEFIVIGVDREAAERHRQDLIDILREYPDADELKSGPSYIAVGAKLGSQDAALQLFALGQVLGLWTVITPAKLGATGEQARELAGNGYVMITPYDIRGQHEVHNPGSEPGTV